jgi:hypothetical protein
MSTTQQQLLMSEKQELVKHCEEMGAVGGHLLTKTERDFWGKKYYELKGEFKILTDFCSPTMEGNDPTAQDMVNWIGSLFAHEDRAIKLEKEKEQLTKEHVVLNQALVKEIQKLKAENQKYKHWASEVIYWSDTHTKNILEEKKLITKDNKPTIDNVRDFGKEIQELKGLYSKMVAEMDMWKEKSVELGLENQKLPESEDVGGLDTK